MGSLSCCYEPSGTSLPLCLLLSSVEISHAFPSSFPFPKCWLDTTKGTTPEVAKKMAAMRSSIKHFIANGLSL